MEADLKFRSAAYNVFYDWHLKVMIKLGKALADAGVSLNVVGKCLVMDPPSTMGDIAIDRLQVFIDHHKRRLMYLIKLKKEAGDKWQSIISCSQRFKAYQLENKNSQAFNTESIEANNEKTLTRDKDGYLDLSHLATPPAKDPTVPAKYYYKDEV